MNFAKDENDVDIKAKCNIDDICEGLLYMFILYPGDGLHNAVCRRNDAMESLSICVCV